MRKMLTMLPILPATLWLVGMVPVGMVPSILPPASWSPGAGGGGGGGPGDHRGSGTGDRGCHGRRGGPGAALAVVVASWLCCGDPSGLCGRCTGDRHGHPGVRGSWSSSLCWSSLSS